MQECLGISVNGRSLNYAKIRKNKKSYEIISLGTIFYESGELKNSIQRIVEGTNSANSLLATNVDNEYYFIIDVSTTTRNEMVKATEEQFSDFCKQAELPLDDYEKKIAIAGEDRENKTSKSILIYKNKNEFENKMASLGDLKFATVVPNAVALPNLLDYTIDENVLIVNLEEDVTLTTVKEYQIDNVTVMNNAIGEIFDKISETENSNVRIYEALRSLTLYTSKMKASNMVRSTAKYLQFVVPSLYKIAERIKQIIKENNKIDKIYLSGAGTMIGNIDKYFEDLLPNENIEILKPFFILNKPETTNVGQIVENNSAIALALQGLGFGIKELNFRTDKGFTKIKNNITMESNSYTNVKDVNFSINGSFSKSELRLVRWSITIVVLILLYMVGIKFMNMRIDEEKVRTQNIIEHTREQIEKAEQDEEQVFSDYEDYEKYYNLIQKMYIE